MRVTSTRTRQMKPYVPFVSRSRFQACRDGSFFIMQPVAGLRCNLFLSFVSQMASTALLHTATKKTLSWRSFRDAQRPRQSLCVLSTRRCATCWCQGCDIGHFEWRLTGLTLWNIAIAFCRAGHLSRARLRIAEYNSLEYVWEYFDCIGGRAEKDMVGEIAQNHLS